MKRSPTMLIAGLLAVAGSAGCTVSTGVPGAPDINIEVAEPAVKQACRDFGRAFADATTADEMRNNMLPAAAAAEEAAQGDPAEALSGSRLRPVPRLPFAAIAQPGRAFPL